jgi:hypothetical protein
MDITGRQVDWRFRYLIPEVRRCFKERICNLEDKDLVYPEDVKKTLEDDLWVERFLEWHGGDVSSSVNGLLFSLKTQKKFRLRELSDASFFSDFHYSLGSLFQYEPDKLGRKTMYVRMKYSPSCKETRDISLQWMLYQNLQMGESCRDTGFININDFAGVSFTHLDMRLLTRGMEVFDIFPMASCLSIAVNLPFFLRSLIKGFQYAFPSANRRGLLILNKEELREVVHLESLPDFLGGTCRRLYCGQHLVPQGSLSIKEHILAAAASRMGLEEGSIGTEIIQGVQKSPLLWPKDFDARATQRVLAYYESLLRRR